MEVDNHEGEGSLFFSLKEKSGFKQVMLTSFLSTLESLLKPLHDESNKVGKKKSCYLAWINILISALREIFVNEIDDTFVNRKILGKVDRVTVHAMISKVLQIWKLLQPKNLINISSLAVKTICERYRSESDYNPLDAVLFTKEYLNGSLDSKIFTEIQLSTNQDFEKVKMSLKHLESKMGNEFKNDVGSTATDFKKAKLELVQSILSHKDIIELHKLWMPIATKCTQALKSLFDHDSGIYMLCRSYPNTLNDMFLEMYSYGCQPDVDGEPFKMTFPSFVHYMIYRCQHILNELMKYESEDKDIDWGYWVLTDDIEKYLDSPIDYLVYNDTPVRLAFDLR